MLIKFEPELNKDDIVIPLGWLFKWIYKKIFKEKE